MTSRELNWKATKYNVKKSGAKRRSRILSVVASIVVFCVTYALIIPALTWEKTLICELPEHTHGDSCYTYVTTSTTEELICSVPEHEHNENCYNKAVTYTCGLEESAGHTHDDTCYDEAGSLICGMEESDGHTHGENCTKTEYTLTCTQDVHTHNESCYKAAGEKTEKVLTCTLQEHTHTDACYDAPPATDTGIYCGKSAHTHTDKCYVAGVLTCTMEEHVHTKQCSSNPKADLETAKTWEASLADVELTGNWSEDVVAIATSQLGNHESENNYLVDDKGNVSGYTRYGAWYGSPYADWCAMFCSFCLHYAGVDTMTFPQDASCPRWVSTLSSSDYDLYRPAGEYLPKPGDLIFFDYDSYTDVSKRQPNHVGIVAEVIDDANGDPVRVRTIEGNTGTGVASNTYNIDNKNIMGYAELPLRPVERSLTKATKAVTATVDAWQEVTEIDDTSANYLVVSNSDYAIGINNSNSLTSTQVEMMEIVGQPGYYTATVGENFQWHFDDTDGTAGMTNAGHSGYGLRLSSSTIISSTSNVTTNTMTYSESGGYWRISYRGSYYTYYLTCSTSGSFSRQTSTTNSNMKIFKAVRLTTGPDGPDGPGGNVVKPTYPDYIDVSDAKTGSTQVGTVSGTYWSDPSTSQLESEFNGVQEDDGKVLADKSVIYGDDDYGAFNSYAPNTFGVELSALGQKYAITQELQVRVPLDVVFVLDTSGSMINTTYDGVTSANIMIESLNKIMKIVMDANEDNRVGVVCYSGSADKLLDLGRYTATNDKYFPEGQCNSNTYELTASSSIRRTDGTLYKGTFDRGWYGTFTQDGIALGAQEFFDVQDTTITKTITQETDEGTVQATYTVTRRPIIILLSDGEPTYCTSDYDKVLDSTNIYGNGNTGYNNNGAQINDSTSSASNNKGILGYYTILTAQNYKDRIAQKYNTDAFFYTIGIGMDPTGNNSYEQSVAGDDYKRAVLNPTADNINHLNECTTATCTSSTITSSTARDISGKIDQTCRMLYRLLHNTQTGSTVKIGNHTQQQTSDYGVRCTQTQQNVPIKTNAYLTSGYDYADGAFFSENNSVETLTQAFTNAISYTDVFPVYGFILKSNTPMTVSDTIGDGMEMKSEPVLRYGGVNHNPTSHETVGNVTTYHYSGTWAATDGSGMSADLSQITATVTTDENGRQTVELTVPDSQLPTYTPNLRNDGSAYFYYEQLPVRLIYQVGLTDKAVREVENLEITGGSKTYYTNAWSEADFSYFDFNPTGNNPYYHDGDYDKTAVPKTNNNTDTFENAREFTYDSTSNHVDETLGNNGRLTFEDTDVQVIPVTIRKLDSNGSPITTDTAIFEVYADTDLTILVGSYETDETGKLLIPGIRTGRTFYLKEVKAPYGYKRLEQLLPFSVQEDGTVTGLSGAIGYYRVNAAGELEVLNDDDTRIVEVEKHWAGELFPGEEYPTSVEIQLYADGDPVQSAVTLNAGNGWYYKWENLPILSALDKHEIEYTVKETPIPSGFLPSYEQDEDGVWIVTNRKVETTTLSVIKKWIGGTAASAQVELLRNGEPTGRFAVLNEENGWYYLWNNLPVCDENGDLTYSVREIAMDGYETEVHCWNGPDDPYGFTESEETRTVDSFSDGLDHLLVFNGKALAANEAGTGLTTVDYEDGDEITDEMLWTASISGNDITLTSVSANKRLVLNSSNQLSLGATSTHATTWRFDSSDRLYANYRSYITRSYYFTGTVNNGVGSTSTTAGNGTALELRTRGITRVYDVEDPGETHYIVVNTKTHYEPPDLTLTIRKISSEDIESEQPVLLNGAKFDLYVETGVVEDGQIPGTDGRIGKVVQSITCDGTAEITLSEDGTYFLVETKAPEGYVPLTEPIIFTVSSEKEVRTATIDYHPVLESGTVIEGFDVPNTPTAYVLPETGGRGVIPYYTIGLLLIAAAPVCGCLLRRKRREEA